MTGFNLTNINDLKFTSTLPTKVPAFYKAYLNVDEVADTFINPTGWAHGFVFVNGFNGKVTGKAPVSPLKVGLLVLLGLAVVAGIVLIYLYS